MEILAQAELMVYGHPHLQSLSSLGQLMKKVWIDTKFPVFSLPLPESGLHSASS